MHVQFLWRLKASERAWCPVHHAFQDLRYTRCTSTKAATTIFSKSFAVKLRHRQLESREIWASTPASKPMVFESGFRCSGHIIQRQLTVPASTLDPDNPIFVTSPIFYVNAAPHIGHLYSAILADTLKRWFSFKGSNTMYSTGTDEHGLKIQQAAAEANTDPKIFCDEISKGYKELFEKASIGHTRFIRTTDTDHYTAVAHLWKRLSLGGFLYKGYHEGWYCVSDETFYPEMQVQASPSDPNVMISKESGKVVEWTKEENYKFRLSDFKDRLIKWLEDNPKVIVPESQYNFVLSQLKLGDQCDISVSRLRSRVSWGIPVPNDGSHVIYVWLDALVNYLTVTGYPWTSLSEEFTEADNAARHGWPAHIHVVGKDIVKFHAIYWPAFLLAAGLPLPRKIISHGHWLMGQQKMSKSIGNVVSPHALIDKWGIDAVRYFLMRDGGIETDPEFSDSLVLKRYKHDLGGHLGNLIMRACSSSINKTGTIPLEISAPLNVAGKALIEKLDTLAVRVDTYIVEGNVSEALELIHQVINDMNKYWTDMAPWKLASDSESNLDSMAQLQSIVFVVYEGLRICSLLLQPIMPGKMANLLDMMDVDPLERTFSNAHPWKRYLHTSSPSSDKQPTLLANQPPLFPRID
ncbi:methionine-tRNA ligase [Batrachochytrium salamandrivorans]|nr:hypothetical protein BASA62_008586 [Batrachochytrium salamandrivorans]KAH9246546.1 methionine-tRNA ligase [Batrachochytrium salamandrivorans]KAH9274211.1 methionine-tRNA ligase [Batrachochytrium salamandrivorans]KAJ1343103.1 methionine-tRNA ligase [Batrachochytrium salamandrivorans]